MSLFNYALYFTVICEMNKDMGKTTSKINYFNDGKKLFNHIVQYSFALTVRNKFAPNEFKIKNFVNFHNNCNLCMFISKIL